MTTLQHIHDVYKAQFPNLRYPIADEETAKRYVAWGLLLGPDVCLPPSLTTGIAAQIIVKYAKDNPQKLTNSEWRFASFALWDAYPCSY